MGEGRRVAGKRAGQRAPRKFRPVILPLAVGITLCVVAWGYLVKAAIDFGTTARGGESHFNVVIESAAFAGRPKVARQRMVYQALADELAGPVHALSVRALAPGEGA